MCDDLLAIGKQVHTTVTEGNALRILFLPLPDDSINLFKIGLVRGFRSEFDASHQGNMEGISVIPAVAFQHVTDQAEELADGRIRFVFKKQLQFRCFGEIDSQWLHHQGAELNVFHHLVNDVVGNAALLVIVRTGSPYFGMGRIGPL